jgi:mono/diheme cytochrome c family protein
MLPNNGNRGGDERDFLAFFVGIVVLMVILAVLFGVFTPDASGVEAGGTEIAAITEATESAAVQPTETPEPTDIPTITAEPTDVPTQTLESTDAPTNTPETEVVEDAGAGGNDTAQTGASDPEAIAHGETLFTTCAACHGADAHGITGLGKDLVNSEFVGSQTDEELVDFIITGRPVWDENNTTGVDMPPKGGNPTLTREDIQDIVAYIRSLRNP